jgi:cyclopropane-fatty-acyl-phospholipid synthase
MLDRLGCRLVRRLLSSIGDPPLTVVLWNGEEIALAETADRERPRIVIHSRPTLWRVLLDPFFQFPEGYADGKIEIEGDLERLACLIDQCASKAPRFTRWLTLLSRTLHWARRNTLIGSKDNIHHHYEIGNDFYRLWLDESLLYSCGYFEEPSASLEQAQVAKMNHVCRKLWLRPGETVIEAGCGWGALALHMAKHFGVRVRAYNISGEQIAEARRRAREEQLDDRVEFILDDWRNITGQCDVFVSIGMLEHVGGANYRRLGAVIDRCLSGDGRGLIHSIGRNKPQPMDPWTERRIFPGAYPPSLGEMATVFEPHDFSILDVENLRLHYAQTLRHWLKRYEESREAVRSMFGERFVRTWHMYLASSVAAFETGNLQLFQVLFARPQLNELPRTRSYQYGHLKSQGQQQEDCIDSSRAVLRDGALGESDALKRCSSCVAPISGDRTD